MDDRRFDRKRINDPIHGSIGLSEVEYNLIKTPIFLRLRNLKQLGLADFVFPGATHTRFAHSIGTMHIVFRMLQQIRLQDGAPKMSDDDIQMVRLAALLHDIGHYPLSHVSESVFFKLQGDKLGAEDIGPATADTATSTGNSVDRPLHEMANVNEVTEVKHENLGRLILKNRSDIRQVLPAEYPPDEIAAIFTGEATDKRFYRQLIHSTLDADRMDFLPRDSHYAGVPYGNVDLDFLISNLKYDPDTEEIGIDYKGIPCFEHFLIGRFFLYNVPFHKTVAGFELMAKVLFNAMISDGAICVGEETINDFDGVKGKIDTGWFESFDDNFYWKTLAEWKPDIDYFSEMKHNLLRRIPLQLLFEEIKLVDRANTGIDRHFDFLKKDLFDRISFGNLVRTFGIENNCLAMEEKTKKFEDQPPYTKYNTKVEKEVEWQLGKVFEGFRIKDLIEIDYSPITKLSQYKHHIRRLFYFNRIGTKVDRENFSRRFKEVFSGDSGS